MIQERYIPSDQAVIQLRQVHENPVAHFLPTVTTDAQTFIYGGPVGFSSELDELFLFPSTLLRRRADTEHAESPQSKRSRIEGPPRDDEEDVEYARRQSLALASERDITFDEGPEEGPGLGDFGDLGGIDTFDFDLDPVEVSGPLLEGAADILAKDRAIRAARSRAQAALEDRSRQRSVVSQGGRLASVAGTPAPEERPEYKLAMFDTRIRTAEGLESQMTTSGTGSQSLPQSLAFLEDSADQDVGGTRAAGVSKNTSMALRVLRTELGDVEDDVVSKPVEPKTLSFKAVAHKVIHSLYRAKHADDL